MCPICGIHWEQVARLECSLRARTRSESKTYPAERMSRAYAASGEIRITSPRGHDAYSSLPTPMDGKLVNPSSMLSPAMMIDYIHSLDWYASTDTQTGYKVEQKGVQLKIKGHKCVWFLRDSVGSWHSVISSIKRYWRHMRVGEHVPFFCEINCIALVMRWLRMFLKTFGNSFQKSYELIQKIYTSKSIRESL